MNYDKIEDWLRYLHMLVYGVLFEPGTGLARSE